MTTRSDSVLWQDLDAAQFTWQIPDRLNIARACLDDQRADDVALIVDDGGTETRFTFGELTCLSRRFAGFLAARGVGAGDRVGVMVPQGVEVVTAHLGSFRAGRGDGAAVGEVRSGGGRLPVAAFGCPTAGDRRRELRPGPPGAGGRGDAAHGARGGRRPGRRGRPRRSAHLRRSPSRNGIRGHRRHHRRLPRHHHLHVGHHRPAQGGAARASHPAGAHAGCADRVRQRTAARRRVLDARGLGVDRRAVRRGVHGDGPGPAGGRHTRPAHPRRDGGGAAPAPGQRHVHAADRPQAVAQRRHHRGRRPGVGAAHRRHRRRIAGHRAARLDRGDPGHRRQRVLRPDRDQHGARHNRGFRSPEPDSMGRAFPGFEVAVLDPEGVPVGAGEVGEICVRAGNPGQFLRYWQQPEATADKVRDGWIHTGDQARRDAAGNFSYQGRADDIISSAGYRVGPGEIEECLLSHPAVAMAAAVGVPDSLRGEAIHAFVVLTEGHSPATELADELRQHVKSRLAFYQYPREITFRTELPLTTTGKIMRRELRDGLAGESRP